MENGNNNATEHKIPKGNDSLKKLIKKTFSLTKDVATHEEIQYRLLSNGTVTGTNMLVMLCAIVIASVGLNTGSTAVIIGAMLISPIMSTILASAFCVITADFLRVRRYLLGLAMQIIISVGASFNFESVCIINTTLTNFKSICT